MKLIYKNAVYRLATLDAQLYAPGAAVPSPEGEAWLKSLDRSGLVFRGMESAEYGATLGQGRPIKSSGKYSLATEGTCFSHDASTAENYVNHGRSDPRKTGKPTYLVAVEQTPEMWQDRDGYVKCPVEVPNESVVAVYEMDDYDEVGEIVARPLPAGAWSRDASVAPLHKTANTKLRVEATPDGLTYHMNVQDDVFVHFAPLDRAKQIVTSGVLQMNPPHKKFGGDAVYAISAVYGEYVPGTQHTHNQEFVNKTNPLVAVVFTTDLPPKNGYIEEVTWLRDVPLNNPKIIPYRAGAAMLKSTPEKLADDQASVKYDGYDAAADAWYYE